MSIFSWGKKKPEPAVSVPSVAPAPVAAETLVVAKTIPAWMKRADLQLPPWAHVRPSTTVTKGAASVCIEADMDGAMQEWLPLLTTQKPDQYWLEVAYQCAKMDVQSALTGTRYDPRLANMPAEIKFTRAARWALSAHPRGKGAEAATKGREAREHYRRVRGRLPF